MKNSLICIILILMFADSISAQDPKVENITCRQAAEMINQHRQDPDFVILDVRTPGEFKGGHLENALLLDYKSTDFQKKIDELDKSKTYLVYCKGGGRSEQAAEIMKTLNFVSIYHLFEGMDIWISQGYPTVK